MHKHLLPLALIVVSTAVSLPLRAQDAPDIPEAEALEQVRAWREQVAGHLKDMNELYQYRKAPVTLNKAFDEKGVQWAKRYSDPWGNNGIYLRWDKVKNYYDASLRALDKSRGIIDRANGASIGQLASLNRQMIVYAQHHEQLQELMKKYVDQLAVQGRHLDAKHAGNKSAGTLAEGARLRGKQFSDKAEKEAKRNRVVGIKDGAISKQDELTELQAFRNQLMEDFRRRQLAFLELPNETDSDRMDRISAQQRLEQIWNSIHAVDGDIRDLGGTVSREQPLPSNQASAPGDLPIPRYANPHSRAGEAAGTLREAQDALAAHLAARPDGHDLQALVNWNGTANERLADMILAEEQLAWAAGDHFTREEREALAPAFENYDNIRASLRELGRTNAQAREVHEALQALEGYHDQLAGEMASSGKTSFTGMALTIMAHRQWSARLAEIEGIGDETRRGLIEQFAATDRIVANAYMSRRNRGVAAINQQLARGVAEGATAPTFVLHRPRTGVEQRNVSRRIFNHAYSHLGGDSVEQRGSGGRVSLWTEADMATDRVRSFDHNERRRLLGDARANRIDRLEGRR